MFIIIYNIIIGFNFVAGINNYKYFILWLIVNIVVINEMVYNKIILFIF